MEALITKLKSIIYLLPVVIALLMMAAHFYRAGQYGLVTVYFGLVLILAIRRSWVPIIIRMSLAVAFFVWLLTAYNIAYIRISHDMPWARATLILGAVALFTLSVIRIFKTEVLKTRYSTSDSTRIISASSFVLTLVTLGLLQTFGSLKFLLLEGVMTGLGWVSAFVLAIYAAFVSEKMFDANHQPKVRRFIWTLFSVVFFLQLFLAIIGLEQFLLNGELHLPIPALILAGPLFRGEGLFMVILLISTLFLVGPAWCSHLCYIGAWDNLSADSKPEKDVDKKLLARVRIFILLLTLGVAIALRYLGTPLGVAVGVASAFGVISVFVIALISRRSGLMIHCISFCPVGLCVNILGRLSPFRVAISEDCTACGDCRESCKYNALTSNDIAKLKPGFTCSLCGDCVQACESGNLSYRFLKLDKKLSRAIFIVMVVTLHAVFLGVARI